MKIFSGKQMKDWDAYTMQEDGITDSELLASISATIGRYIIDMHGDESRSFTVLCGSGNNGSIGIAIAKLLYAEDFEVDIIWLKTTAPSGLFFHQLDSLPIDDSIKVLSVSEGDVFPDFEPDAVLIDAIYGTELNRSLKGYWADLVEFVNTLINTVVSIDMPSGMLSDFYTDGVSVYADEVICLATPKLGYFMGSNLKRFDDIMYIPNEHSKAYEQNTETDNYITQKIEMGLYLKSRDKWMNKDDFGHALLVMGKEGMMGAAVLSSRACMRSGVGKCTVQVPACGRDVLQISNPEAMVIVDINDKYITQNIDYEQFDAIGIGCGIGINNETASVLSHIFSNANKPLVVDADALNIIAKNQELLSILPRGTILTPHVKEFDRLFGNAPNDFVRLDTQKAKSREYGIVIVLKCHNTSITDERGQTYFNTTGNVGMATAGAGDVLTGIICGLLAQGYAPNHAALIGVFLHGMAGDIVQNKISAEAMIASDLIENIHKAFDVIHINDFEDLLPF